MAAPVTYTIPPEASGARADQALARAFPQHSRMAFQRAFAVGLIARAGRPLARSDRVRAGERVEFAFPETRPATLRPVAIPLDVIYEDAHLLAVNKASGMVVHPGAATGEDTLVHALLAHCAGGLSGIGGVERPGIVHRIDRETSGLVVVAKTDAAHRGLAAQFAARTLVKEYLAIVAGVPDLLSGSIRRAIARHPAQRHKMTVVDTGGRAARTDWVRAECFDAAYALVRCTIHTGRTHQIRVHLKSLGHPLLGDAVYGWKSDPRLPEPPRRVMLHAEHLVVTHPITGQVLDLRAPPPADFRKMLAQLRKLWGGEAEPAAATGVRGTKRKR